MSKQPTEASGTAPTTFPALPPFPFDGAMALVRAGERSTMAWLEMQQELARFATARWQKDLGVPVSLASCRDLADLVSLQEQWLDTATKDYMAEGEQLMRIADRAVRDGLTSWSEAEPGTAAVEEEVVQESAAFVE